MRHFHTRILFESQISHIRMLQTGSLSHLFGVILAAVAASESTLEPPGEPTVGSCPRFVSEGESATCECQAGFHETPPSDFSLTWPGHSDTPFLQLTNVTRKDNGKSFTCLMVWGGHYRLVNYILQAAYGPDDARTTIVGPTTFIADGKTPLTLTCRASQVNPIPIYTWDTDRCEKQDVNTDVCSFIPDPFRDDGLLVQCNARSRAGRGHMGTAKYVINLQYPPWNAPFISGETLDISHDSQLGCTVRGGKPQVSKVIFTCAAVQQMFSPFSNNQSQEGVVSSSLIINKENSDKNNSFLCTCRGVWEPQKDLYTLTSHRLVHVPTLPDNKEDAHRYKCVGTIAGLIFGILEIVCFIFFVIRYVQGKQSRHSNSTVSEQQCEQPLTSGVNHCA